MPGSTPIEESDEELETPTANATHRHLPTTPSIGGGGDDCDGRYAFASQKFGLAHQSGVVFYEISYNKHTWDSRKALSGPMTSIIFWTPFECLLGTNDRIEDTRKPESFRRP